MQIFARLIKVNEAERTLEGLIASETVDRAGEVFDYEKSVPHFKAWSESMGKATDGKNVGNVRAMHGNVSAGITKAITFDDAAKQIVVKAEITDDNEWRKVMKGNYTGFSIGGKYGTKWDDPVLKAKRYEAIPTEYSLVDAPCNPDATFTVVKADGAQELHKFDAFPDTDAGWGEWLAKVAATLPEAELAKIARRKGVDPKDGEDKYGDVEYADEKNKKYPIDTAKHIRAAWSYIHMPKNAEKYDAADLKTIKARIAAAWKEKIDKDGPPEAAKKAEKLAKRQGAAELADIIWKMLGGQPMEKGLWAVSQFAQLLDALAMLADGTVYETEAEGDDSDLPKVMAAALKPLAHAFLAMANEETDEALHGQLNDDAAIGGDPAKAAGGNLAKVGRKHTKKTRAHLAAIREHLDALQADDPQSQQSDDDDDDGAQKLAKAADDLQKMTAERDALTKAVSERDEMLLKAAERLGQQDALIKQLEQLPGPSKATLYAVGKSAEAVGKTEIEVHPVLKADGTVDEAATAIRKALQNPVRTR